MSSVKDKFKELQTKSLELKEIGKERNQGMFSFISYQFLEDHPELRTDELSSFYKSNILIPSKKIIELREQYKKTVTLEIVEELNFLGFEIGYDLTTGEDIYSFEVFKKIFYAGHDYILSGVIKQVVKESLSSLNDAVVDLTPFWFKTNKVFIGDWYSWSPNSCEKSIDYIKCFDDKVNEFIFENDKISSKIVELGKRIDSFDYRTNIDFVGKGSNLASRTRLDLSNMLKSGERSIEAHERLREFKEKK